MRRYALGALALVFAIPSIAAGKIDAANCSGTTMTSAIAGTVKDARNVVVPSVTVELYTTNATNPLQKATTDSLGKYLICAGTAGGAGHDTYDVHVRDDRTDPQFAGANQPYTTYTRLGPTEDLDFTPASGYPLLYLANLRITPNAISTADGPVNVTWTVRSKAPNTTTWKLTLGHKNQTFGMTLQPAEGGGPAGGGWNVWSRTESFNQNSTEALWWATAQGFSGSTAITQLDRVPYVIDNKGPIFGLADSSTGKCGPGSGANAFAPVSPPGTTNPQPIVTIGVCDSYSNGAKSGLDPFSLSAKMCLDAAMSTGCKDIDPVLNTNTIIWFPRTPLALGNYFFKYTISDMAGNTTTTPTAHKLTITNTGGQVPRITSVAPSNLGSGSTLGIVVGSSLTTPNSLPWVGFRVTDADGQMDLAPGSLRVRIYYMSDGTGPIPETGLVYDYDPTKSQNEYDTLTHKGGALFNLAEGTFRATGYTLAGKPPGRYIASASITDHGGNTATMTWHWILVAAA